MRVLIAGCGYVGAALSARLVGDGHEVFGLRRRPSDLPEGVHPVAADISDPATLRALPRVEALVFTAAPSQSGAEAYRRVYVEGLRNLLDASGPPARVLFTSSTAVYGEGDGRVVDETSATEPASYRGELLLEAESLVAPLGPGGTVLRLAGIYGPGRARLLEQVLRGEAEYVSSEVSNRIHRDDAAGALRHLLGSGGPVYVGADCEPAEKRAVLEWLAERIGSAPPRERTSPSRPRGSKRCSNRRLLQSGYRFQYPTFREGFQSLLEDG